MSAGTRLVRRQLAIFATVALVAVLVVSLRYVQVPRLLGWGRMEVTAQLPSTGGLGANARVTYRGLEVGRVEQIRLRPGGVVARLAVDRDAQLPADVRAQVHSTSVIGEQYLELLPTRDSADGERGATTGMLAAGATVPPAARGAVPVDAQTLLGTVDRLLRSVDSRDLKTTVDELDTAFRDTRTPLTTLLDGSHDLIGTAQENLGATRQLIRTLDPVLRTQDRIAPDVESIAANLSDVTGELKARDGDLRSLIDQTPAAADQIGALATDLNPVLPEVLANLAGTGQVLRVYLAGIKQLLVLYPAQMSTLQVVALTGEPKGRIKLYFHLNINDPAPCREGFTGKHRSHRDLTPTARLGNGYCQAGATAQTAVRGARNAPCPNSAARSATAAGCGLDFTAEPRVSVTSYDPETGAFLGPDGRRYTLDLSRQAVPGRSPYSSGLLTALTKR